jgi:hypothetical protein
LQCHDSQAWQFDLACSFMWSKNAHLAAISGSWTVPSCPNMLLHCKENWECYATARKCMSLRTCRLCPDETVVTEKHGNVCALCWAGCVTSFPGHKPCTGPDCVESFKQRVQEKERETARLEFYMRQALQTSQLSVPVTDRPVAEDSPQNRPLATDGPLPPDVPPPPPGPPPPLRAPSTSAAKNRPGLFVASPSSAQASSAGPSAEQPSGAAKHGEDGANNVHNAGRAKRGGAKQGGAKGGGAKCGPVKHGADRPMGGAASNSDLNAGGAKCDTDSAIGPMDSTTWRAKCSRSVHPGSAGSAKCSRSVHPVSAGSAKHFFDK